MAFRSRSGYRGQYSDAGHSRRRGRPGPWNDQYRHYNDYEYADSDRHYHHQEYDSGRYEPYGYYAPERDRYGQYSQDHSYDLRGGGYGAWEARGWRSYADREYYPQDSSSSASYGRDAYDRDRWTAHGQEAHEEREVYREHAVHAPLPHAPESTSMSQQGQTRGYHHSHRDDWRPEARDRSRERARSPLPPPPPPPPPRAPSPAYLELSQLEPEELGSPANARKLLILDLNGTLVFRSAYRPKKPARQDGEQQADGSGPPGGSRLRAAHPRPYLPSFRDYLFAPETQAWLDVMVWSSAQPHSVRGMVERVFGPEVYEDTISGKAQPADGAAEDLKTGEAGDEDTKDLENEKGTVKPRLLAIWARDTLGLSESHYRQKVQTVKDLNIPWSKLPKLLVSERSTTPTPPRSSSPRLPDTAPSPLLAPRAASPSAYTHSALSTLLLDDSPLKAVRQPYNHVCIPEYDAKRRASDLSVFMREKMRLEQLEDENAAGDAVEASAADDAPAASTSEAQQGEPADDDKDATRKRKRFEKKLKKRQERLAKTAAEEQRAESTPLEEDEYDPTLLAVVGVLDTIKRQRNVAAWVRAGGLWGPARRTADVALAEEVEEAEEAEEDEEEDMKDSPSRKRARHRSRSAAAAGNDTVSTVERVEGEKARDAQVEEGKSNVEVQPMWFEDPATLQYWVERGKRALEELGIPIDHGIER